MADYERFAEKARALRVKADAVLADCKKNRGLSARNSIAFFKVKKQLEELRKEMASVGLNLDMEPNIKEHLDSAESVVGEISEIATPRQLN